MDRKGWDKWRFKCPLYNRGDCTHQERKTDHERRCYCQNHDEAYGKNSSSSEQNIRAYTEQADAINDHAWERCPLKSLTHENATKEGCKQKIQLQIAYAVRCSEEEINARLKLNEMKAAFEERYHEKC